MGILDSKSRIFDVLVTPEGRRQIADGSLKIKFVSFNDRQVDYGCMTDQSSTFYFEATGLPTDQIVSEYDDSGKLISKPGFIGFDSQLDGQVLADTIVNNILDLSTLMTDDPFDDEEEFQASEINSEISVNASDATLTQVGNLESSLPLFSDQRLNHLPNFQFLPPKNSPTPAHPNGSPLGVYDDFDKLLQEQLTFSVLKSKLANKQIREVTFEKTSKESNILSQVYEQTSSGLKKLDVIDFGVHVENGNERRVFFAGKLFKDSDGIDKFLNIFTLVFE